MQKKFTHLIKKFGVFTLPDFNYEALRITVTLTQQQATEEDARNKLRLLSQLILHKSAQAIR